MYYFVYVKDLIAIETDLKDFEWTFGRLSSQIDKEDFDKSLIRIHLRIDKDSRLAKDSQSKIEASQFSSFFISAQKKEIVFQKNLFKFLTIAYKLRIDGNDICFSVGRAYYKLIRHRLMNLHSVRYILSDLVSGMLLLNNYAPLYCATVYDENSMIMLFGAPAVGKTLSVMHLVKRNNFRLMSEDVSISDGKAVWSVPYTSTYNQHNKRISIKKNHPPITGELITKLSDRKYIFLLEKGKEKTGVSIPEKIELLNRYIFHYDNSPITTVCAYFFNDFKLSQMRENEQKIVRQLCEDSLCTVLHENDSFSFADNLVERVHYDCKE